MNPSDIFDTSSHFFSIFAVIGLGWWLSGRFRIVEETARDIGSSIKSELIQLIRLTRQATILSKQIVKSL